MTGKLLRVTEAQRRLWAGYWHEPDKPSYNVAQCVRISGPLDHGGLESAVTRLCAEVEALRVRITERDGEPYQIVEPAGPAIRLPVIDLSSAQDPEAAARAWIRDDLASPVHPYADQLFAIALLKTGDDRFLWYLRFHQIALDGFSAALLFDRVAQIYTAQVTGRPCPPNRFRPLRSFVDEEIGYRASARFQEDLRYWTDRMTGSPAPAQPTPSPSTPTRVVEGSTDVTPELGLVLAVARAARTGWPDVVVAAAALHLAQEHNVPEVVLGMLVSARTTELSRHVPTYSSNTVPVRIRIDAGQTFLELIRSVATETRQALRRQRFPYGVLTRPDGTPLAGPKINLMPFVGRLPLPGCETEVVSLSIGPVDDLEIIGSGEVTGAGLQVHIAMRTAVGDAGIVSRRERRFAHLWQRAVVHPQAPIGEFFA